MAFHPFTISQPRWRLLLLRDGDGRLVRGLLLHLHGLQGPHAAEDADVALQVLHLARLTEVFECAVGRGFQGVFKVTGWVLRRYSRS